jgi:DNA-binding NarL/FixJ family response regulator
MQKLYPDNIEVVLQRVLVVSSDRPLIAGIEGLLKNEADLHLVSTSATEISGIIQEARRTQSRVIIVDDSLPWTSEDFFQDLLLSFSELRVVVVSNLGNTLQIFDKKAVEVCRFQDLVSIVRETN